MREMPGIGSGPNSQGDPVSYRGVQEMRSRQLCWATLNTPYFWGCCGGEGSSCRDPTFSPASCHAVAMSSLLQGGSQGAATRYFKLEYKTKRP